MEKVIRTVEERAAEVEALKEVKDKVPSYNYFGDSNLSAILAEIKVIESGWSDVEQFANWSGQDEGYAYEHARDAVDWLTGASYDDTESEAPSVGWKSLAAAVAKKNKTKRSN